MANGTSGHESEFINVQDLKAALQKFKTDKVDVKVDKVTGKGLSTNDYTTDEKNKLSGIATGATNVTTDTVSGWGYTKNAGTVTGVKVNGTTKSPSSGVVDIGTVLTSHQSVTDSNPTLSWGTKSKVATIGSTAINVTMPSNPNTDKNVKVNTTNPGAMTTYYPVWYSAASGTGELNANDGFEYRTQEGTTGAPGFAEIVLGNNISTGNAGNKSGEIVLYSDKGGCSFLQYKDNATDNVAHILPASGGTILTSGTSSVTLSGETLTVKINDISKSLTNTTYSSKAAASGGSDVSLVTTGEKYTWNNKSNFSGSYNDLSNKPTSLPASDVSAWAKASTKPSYTLDEVSDGSSRKLASYLPLTGGTMTGDITMSGEHSIKLSNSTSWSNYYRTIPFSKYDDNTAIAFTSDNLQYNPHTDRLLVGGYVKRNSSDSYVLLGGGGHAAISGLSVSNADTLDGHHGSYYAAASSLNNYLPLTGGTMTGLLTINASSYKQNLCLHRTDGATNPVITFSNATDGYLGCIGFASSTQSGVEKMPYVEVDGTMRTLIHSGNIGSQSVSYATSAGTASTADMIKNNITVSSSSSGDNGIRFSNGTRTVLFGTGTSGNTGIYVENIGWVVGVNSSGSVFLHNNVGIGVAQPSYNLHVNGPAAASAFVNTSDIRKKDIIENLDLDIEDIANAPIFKFSWLDPDMPEGVNVGTSAQYWQTIIPELVSEANDDEKTLSMQYGVAGLVSSVALAKKVVEQEETIKAQEARIKALEDAIANIQNMLNK